MNEKEKVSSAKKWKKNEKFSLDESQKQLYSVKMNDCALSFRQQQTLTMSWVVNNFEFDIHRHCSLWFECS